MPRIRYGTTATWFHKSQSTGLDCAHCLHFSIAMSHESLHHCKLANHCDKKHPRRKVDDADDLSAKKARYDWEVTLPHFGFLPEEKPAVQCSYRVPYQIAKCKNPHIIAEDLIKPCAAKRAEIMIGPGAKKQDPASLAL